MYQLSNCKIILLVYGSAKGWPHIIFATAFCLLTKGGTHSTVGWGNEPQYWRFRVRLPAKTVEILKWPIPSACICCFTHPNLMPTADIRKSFEGRHLVIANCPTLALFVVPSFLLLCDTYTQQCRWHPASAIPAQICQSETLLFALLTYKLWTRFTETILLLPTEAL